MTPASSSPQPTRPAELEDWLNRQIYHPLSWRLARRLASTAVTPNMVSVAGASVVILAAASYGLLADTWGAMLGLLLHIGWHVVDGADGDLARLTGRSSVHGELVDGICDYAGHIVLYVTMGAIAASQIGGMGWAMMLAAGASRVVQAAHYEGTRRQYQLAVFGTPWMGSEAPVTDNRGRRHPFVAFYLWLTGLIVPHGAALQAAACDPATGTPVRDAMRQHGKNLFARIELLSANYRTLAIGAAMLAGRPHWYFLFEIVVLGGVLFASLTKVRQVMVKVLAQAGASSTVR
jgi:phosphatidylglycerophosphate synthase